MIGFIKSNLSTIIVSVALLGVVCAIVCNLVKRAKNGGECNGCPSCGGGCGCFKQKK